MVNLALMEKTHLMKILFLLVSAGESNNGEYSVYYPWSFNNRGQLGLRDRENRAHLEVVKTFDEETLWTIYDISCGATHTTLLIRKKKSTELESKCWTFGLGNNGQFGHRTTQSALFSTPVQNLPQDIYLIGIDCDLFHTSVVSSSGDVWSWGMEKGLGLCLDAARGSSYSRDALSPLRKLCTPYQPKFSDLFQVACGAAHTVVVARMDIMCGLGVGGDVEFLEPITYWIVIPPPRCGSLQRQKIQRKRNQRAPKPSKNRTQPTTAPMENLPTFVTVCVLNPATMRTSSTRAT
ncbi:uncharacterized protein LOC130945869 [Arachis stenosperma]|uniref:uncharacterized protein LOC130945869 n=1 Tax=Arachis stenosperma TaxID=217475 RepID=UPI0025AC3E61|nr:uncharacterized protein LOC130945869 [Arachis stenosperma]